MDFGSYKQFWNNQAQTPEAALVAVDGSSNETIIRRTGRFAASQMRAALALQAQDQVLDLGCGVGRIGRELAAECARWTGVDISEQMITHARERMDELPNTEFHQLHRSALDMLPDEQFDKAYSYAVLCHMDKEDLYLYLEELRRVLKPGGLAYVDTWNLAHPTGWKRWLYEVRFWQRSEQNQRKDIARNQFCSPDELKLYAEQAGLQVLACFDDSHWLQLVLGNDLSPHQLEQQIQRLQSQREAIAYSPLFVDLFEQAAAVTYGELHPREVLSFLDQHAGTAEEVLFRPYITGLWENNTQVWGSAPA